MIALSNGNSADDFEWPNHPKSSGSEI